MKLTQAEHPCTLKKVDTTCLPQLPPNASTWTKFLRCFRKLTLLDLKSTRSRNFFRNKSTMMAEKNRHAKGYPFVIHPFSKLSFVVQCMLVIVWSFNIIFVFVRYLILVDHMYPFIIFQALDTVQVLTIISFFVTGFVDEIQKVICINPKVIALRYLKTYFIFDLTATYLDDVLFQSVDWAAFKSTSNPAYYTFTVVMMLAFTARIVTLMDVVHVIVTEFGGADWVYFLVSRILCIVFCLNAFACLVASIPALLYTKKYPDKIWLVRVNVDDSFSSRDEIMLDRYLESLLLVTVTFFGIPYYKCKITEVSDYVPLMLIRIFGRLFTLYTLADFLRYFGLTGVAESKYDQYRSQINEFAMSKELPDAMKNKILSYYEFKMRRNYFDEKKIAGNLSEPLKIEIFLHGAKRLIRNTPLKNLNSFVLAELFAHVIVETYLPKDVVYSPGAKLDSVYIVSCGTLIVYNEHGIEFNHYVDGDEFAVVNMYTGKAPVSLIVAGEITEVFRIPRSIMRQFLFDHPTLAKFYEKRAADRFRQKAAYEELLKSGGRDVITQLRERKLLERRGVRQRVAY